MSEDTSENHKKKKTSFLKKFLITISIILGVFALFVAYQAYMYANPMARINFATFAPADKEVKNPQLYIRTHHFSLGDKLQDTVVFPEITLHYQSDGMKVMLRKESGFAYDCDRIYTVECAIQETPHGQKYVYGNDPKTESKGGVSFSRDGTEVYIQPIDKSKVVTEKDWSDFIDSLQPVKFEHLEVRRVPYTI